MKFFHITKETLELPNSFLAEACIGEGIEYVQILESQLGPLGHVKYDLGYANILYRSARGSWGRTLERELSGDNCKTIFLDQRISISGVGQTYYHMRRVGLRVVPAIPFLPSKKRETAAVAEYLGGFPLAIKVLGGMEGVGVIKVDSSEALNSISDFLRKDESKKLMLMKFIEHDFHVRLVVVGDEVVVANRDTAPFGDFRTNARGPREKKGESFLPPAELVQDALRAVQACGVTVGGVDVLCDTVGNFYFAEINNPFNFAESQKVTGVDIARKIVQHLASK